MITYEQALKKAQKLNKSVNYCMEYTDAFVFSDKNDDDIGGNGPVVIMKSNGDAVNMAYYVNTSEGDYVKAYDLKAKSEKK